MGSFLLHFLRFYHMMVAVVQSSVRSLRRWISEGRLQHSPTWHLYSDHALTSSHHHSMGPWSPHWLYCTQTHHLTPSSLMMEHHESFSRIPWLSTTFQIQGHSYSLDDFLCLCRVNTSTDMVSPLTLGQLLMAWCIYEGRWFHRGPYSFTLTVIDSYAETHVYTQDHLESTFDRMTSRTVVPRLSHEKN